MPTEAELREWRRSAALWAREADRDRQAVFDFRPMTHVLTERTTPAKPPLCRVGFHDEVTGTTGREGFVRFVQCRRRGCGWSAIRKGT